MKANRFRRALVIASCAALTASVAACADSDRGDSEGDGGTMVFAAAGAPKNFDPIWNDDGESFRPIRQMYETLIANKPGTAELEPALAEKWELSGDGKQITFSLRKGVKFQDGTPFNAEAVCFNADRWFNMKGAAAQGNMIYYADVFEGFAKNDGEFGAPVFKGCEAKDENTAVISLNKFKGAFPGAFTLTSFSISSPTALKKYPDTDTVKQSGDSFEYGEYANAHPVGTGPFKFESFDKSSGLITLVRNDDYWGDKAKLKKLIFKIIPDESARKQELEAGTIDGYDLPSPADYSSLKSKGFNVAVRPAFNVLYLGINQSGNPKLKDIRVRQAIAYAINRPELVKTKLPEGAEVAKEFLPDTVDGYSDSVTTYDYNLQKAKDLLKAAGAENLKLKFYYPTEVTRPYMPNPQELFTVISTDLKAAGITVEPVARPWNGGYKDDVQQLGKHDLHLLGWTGDYNDAGNFVGTFFGRQKKEFGFNNPALFSQIAAADATTDAGAHKKAYEEVNQAIMEYLPAIPISHSPPALVVSSKIKGLVPSPLTDERFSPVSKS